jgi:hypothetical protein
MQSPCAVPPYPVGNTEYGNARSTNVSTRPAPSFTLATVPPFPNGTVDTNVDNSGARPWACWASSKVEDNADMDRLIDWLQAHDVRDAAEPVPPGGDTGSANP